MDGVLAEHEALRDLCVREPLRDQPHDLELAASEELIAWYGGRGCRRPPKVSEQLPRPGRFGSRPDRVQTLECQHRLPRGCVLAARRGEHPREREPRAREFESGPARGEQVDGFLELRARGQIVARGCRYQSLAETRRRMQRTRSTASAIERSSER